MILYLCSRCNRPGYNNGSESTDLITCRYCGSKCSYWVSRPDLKRDSYEEGDASLRKTEFLFMQAIDRVYQCYDTVGIDWDQKKKILGFLQQYLLDFVNIFEVDYID